MKLRDLIKVDELELDPVSNKRYHLSFKAHRIAVGKGFIEDQKNELCRDVMHAIGLTEKEMIELEQRQK